MLRWMFNPEMYKLFDDDPNPAGGGGKADDADNADNKDDSDDDDGSNDDLNPNLDDDDSNDDDNDISFEDYVKELDLPDDAKKSVEDMVKFAVNTNKGLKGFKDNQLKAESLSEIEPLLKKMGFDDVEDFITKKGKSSRQHRSSQFTGFDDDSQEMGNRQFDGKDGKFFHSASDVVNQRIKSGDISTEHAADYKANAKDLDIMMAPMQKFMVGTMNYLAEIVSSMDTTVKGNQSSLQDMSYQSFKKRWKSDHGIDVPEFKVLKKIKSTLGKDADLDRAMQAHILDSPELMQKFFESQKGDDKKIKNKPIGHKGGAGGGGDLGDLKQYWNKDKEEFTEAYRKLSRKKRAQVRIAMAAKIDKGVARKLKGFQLKRDKR